MKSKALDLKVWLSIIFIVGMMSHLSAQESIMFPEQTGQMINAQIEVFHTSEVLTARQAYHQITSGQMDESLSKVNQGMKHPSDGYWLTFTINNTAQESQKAYLELDYPQMDFIELFAIQNESPENLFTTGDRFVFDQRPIQSRNFVLPITLSANRSHTYLLHLEKLNSTMRFPIYLHDESGYRAHYFNSNLKFSFYFGFILLVALVSMVLGFIVKVDTFKIYSFYVLSFALWLFTRLGYSYQFLVSDFPEFNRHLLAASGQLAIMGLILYVQLFFRTKKSMPRFHRIMDVVLVIFIVGAIVWISFPDAYVNFAPKLFILRYSLFTTTIVFAFSAAINYYKIERFRSTMFLLAYSIFLLAIIGKILLDYGAFVEESIPFDPIKIGFLIEVVVLSTAMGMILKSTLQKSEEVTEEHQDLKRQMEIKEAIERKGFLKLNSKAILSIDQISHIKSDDHYLEFNLADGKKEIDRNTLNQTIASLPPHFIQTHRSYVINLNHARALYADRVMMQNGEEVKLSRTFKKKFQRQLNDIQKN